MFQERRQHERLSPTTPQLVLLDETKYSLLFDLCEGGLAIEGFAAQNPLDEFAIELDLPGSKSSIQAKAEVVWTSTTGYRTGLRFVDLQGDYREQLKTWLVGTKSGRATGEKEVQLGLALESVRDNPEAALEAVQRRRLQEQEKTGAAFPTSAAELEGFGGDYESLSESRASTFASWLIVSAAMCLLAFYMGYHWRAAHPGAGPARATVAAVPTAVPKIVPKASTERPPEPAPPTASDPTFSEPGFVLQVAAMKSEANANALSAKLQNRNFSAFVFKRSPGRFFRVVVGPFRTEDLAMQAQRGLTARGYKSLLRRWSPE